MSALARAQLFGLPTLEHAGTSRRCRSSGAPSCWPCSALRRDWVSRAEAARLLWPDQADKLALGNLRKTLFRLPSLPWGALVVAEGSALRSTGETDVAAFQAAVQEGRLAEALALYAGDLLAGFDDDANEPWTRLARLRARAPAADLARGGARLAGRARCPAPRRWRSRPACCRSTRSTKRRSPPRCGWLQRTGQHAAAARRHARFVERMAEELGLAPGARLLALGASLGPPVVGARPCVGPATGHRRGAAPNRRHGRPGRRPAQRRRRLHRPRRRAAPHRRAARAGRLPAGLPARPRRHRQDAARAPCAARAGAGLRRRRGVRAARGRGRRRRRRARR